ncbi:hypothetical protein ACEQUB_p00551 (plasmid) [Ralstonia syzygii]|uniref:Uncharacterized protein n=1 Tax=Ralstonia syzygii R24 TaxID=907261 RepID=G3A902_9RALS|nr:hypothetical protein RALSY_mp10261 [Ralstonia syzygii R24]
MTMKMTMSQRNERLAVVRRRLVGAEESLVAYVGARCITAGHRAIACLLESLVIACSR